MIDLWNPAHLSRAVYYLYGIIKHADEEEEVLVVFLPPPASHHPTKVASQQCFSQQKSPAFLHVGINGAFTIGEGETLLKWWGRQGCLSCCLTHILEDSQGPSKKSFSHFIKCFGKTRVVPFFYEALSVFRAWPQPRTDCNSLHMPKCGT